MPLNAIFLSTSIGDLVADHVPLTSRLYFIIVAFTTALARIGIRGEFGWKSMIFAEGGIGRLPNLMQYTDRHRQ